jgi:hypothetical protein
MAQETVDWASGAEVEGATEPDPKPNSSLEGCEVEPLVDDELPAWPGWLARARSTTAAKATAAATAARFFAPSARCRAASILVGTFLGVIAAPLRSTLSHQKTSAA